MMETEAGEGRRRVAEGLKGGHTACPDVLVALSMTMRCVQQGQDRVEEGSGPDEETPALPPEETGLVQTWPLQLISRCI